MGSGTPLDHPGTHSLQSDWCLTVCLQYTFKCFEDHTVDVNMTIVLCMDGSLSSD